MSLSDPVADMLTSIRNANTALKPYVDVPASKLKGEILRVLQEQRYIQRYNFIQSGPQGIYRIYLKYTSDRRRVISNLRRISKPSLRRYVSGYEIPQVLGGLGLAVLTTSKGVKSDDQCRAQKLGGEVICYVW